MLGLIAGSQTHLGICDERKYEKEAPQNINGTGAEKPRAKAVKREPEEHAARPFPVKSH